MTYRLEFILPGLPKMLNGSCGNYYTVNRERKRWRNAVYYVANSKRPHTPLAKAKLTLTRFSSVCPDYDGLVAGFKSVVDGLRDAGIIENDTIEHLGVWDCKWQKVGPGAGRISVLVESI